jgi:hypothetical protein
LGKALNCSESRRRRGRLRVACPGPHFRPEERGRLLPRGEFFVARRGRAGPCERRSRARAATSLRAHFVERERKPLGAKAASLCDMPAQLANESFRADYVRFGNSVGAVMQVLMRSDIPAAEAFFRDHLRVSPTGQKFRRPTAVGCARRRGLGRGRRPDGSETLEF